MSESPRFRFLSVEARGLLALGVCLCLLFFPRISPPKGLWWEAGWDALHFPGFFVITWGIEHLLSHVVTERGARVALAAGLALVVALGSELVHDLLGRASSVSDLIHDLIGIAYAVLVLLAGPRCRLQGIIWLVVVGASLLTLLFVPALRIEWKTSKHSKYFPNLGAFTDACSLAVWKTQGNARVALLPAKPGLRVEIGQGQYSGVSFDPSHPDWSEKQTLVLVIENPGEPFKLGIRVDDALTDATPKRTRWEKGQEIPHGTLEIRIPLAEIVNGPKDRMMDLGRVSRLALYTGVEAEGRIFIINSAFLE